MARSRKSGRLPPRESRGPAHSLACLEELWPLRDPAAAREKRKLLRALSRASFASASALRRFHDLALRICAFPDDAATLAVAERALRGFERRRDLARFRDELADSGIAGTDLVYPFFHATARRLARRLPDRLTIAWETFDEEELVPLAELLAVPEEASWLREREPGARAAFDAFAGSKRTDAVALHDRLDALPADDTVREAIHDRAAPIYRLAPGRSGDLGPSRTTARAPRSSVVFRSVPFDGRRPSLAAELDRPPRAVREARGAEARALVELARDAMATRARDLDCFAYGDPRDVRRFVHDDGLEFVAIGSLPARRLPLSSAYGLLTVRNGIPTGYVQLDGFLGTALVHFNVFDAFRGTDAAWVFARALATARALFGSDAFAIEPYQLGHGNDEALDSGAWWFYRKLGWAPKEDAAARLSRAEARRLARSARARTPRATLARLARAHLYWEPFGRAAAVAPHAALARVTLAATSALDLPVAEARVELGHRAARLVGLDRARLARDERVWLERWAAMLLALPGVESWPLDDRRTLGDLVRAKAARRESELVPLSRSHPRFGPALLELANRHGAGAELTPPD